MIRRTAAIVLAAGALLAGVAQPAQATTLFNIPRAAGGTVDQQYILAKFVERKLATMPAGSIARIAVYDITIRSAVDAMIAAHLRGVQVRVIMDDANVNGLEQRLISTLGTNVNARSFVALCDQSCNSDQTSAMHSKFFLFSHDVTTVVGSANLTDTNQYLNWNESQALNDRGIYLGMIRVFDQMRHDVNNPRVFKQFTSADGSKTLYHWPSGSSASDVVLNALKSMPSSRCRNVPSGYGNGKGRGLVSVVMFYGTDYRIKIADEMVRLHKAGCDVRFSFPHKPHVYAIGQKFIDRLWYGGVPLWDNRQDVNGDGATDLYAHSKMELLSGWVHGKWVSLSYSGSANLTGTALIYGNETIIRSKDKATIDKFLGRHRQILAHATRETARPTVTPKPLAKSQQVNPAETAEANSEDLERL